MSIIPKNEAATASAKYKEEVEKLTNTVTEDYVLKYSTRGIGSLISKAESTELGNSISSRYGAAKKHVDIPKKYRNAMQVEDVRCAREILKILVMAAGQNIQVVKQALTSLKGLMDALIVALDSQKVIYEIQAKAIEIANYESELKRIALVKGIDVAQNSLSLIPYVDQLRSASASCPDIAFLFTYADETLQMPIKVAKGLLFEIDQKLSLAAEIYSIIEKIEYVKQFLKGFIRDVEYVLSVT